MQSTLQYHSVLDLILTSQHCVFLTCIIKHVCNIITSMRRCKSVPVAARSKA